MTESQALTLLAALTAAYPKHPFTPETAAVYATQIRDFDADVAGRAVESLIQTSMWFPSIAEIFDEYRRFWQSRPQQRELEQRQPTPEERAETAARMRALAENFGLRPDEKPEENTAGLVEAMSGRCDDCGEQARLRWRYGKFTLCHGCVTMRRRAASSSAASTVSGPA